MLKQGHRHKLRALVKENVKILKNSQKLSNSWKLNLDVILVTFGSLCAWGPALSMMRVCVREERGGDEEEGLWDVGCTLYHPCSINCNFCWWPVRFWTDKIIASCKTFNKSFKLKGKCVITDAIGGGGFYIYYIVHLVNLYNSWWHLGIQLGLNC